MASLLRLDCLNFTGLSPRRNRRSADNVFFECFCISFNRLEPGQQDRAWSDGGAKRGPDFRLGCKAQGMLSKRE
jgi:hypothetical protein